MSNGGVVGRRRVVNEKTMIGRHGRTVRRRHWRCADDLNAVVDVVRDAAQAVAGVDATQRREVDVQVVKGDWWMGAAGSARVLASGATLNQKQNYNCALHHIWI